MAYFTRFFILNKFIICNNKNTDDKDLTDLHRFFSYPRKSVKSALSAF